MKKHKAEYEVKCELGKATCLFGSFHSAHEGFAVLKEEVDELWDAVKLNQKNPKRMEKMREEAIQVAAMAIRFLIDCVDDCVKELKEAENP